MKALTLEPGIAMNLLLDHAWAVCEPWTTDFRGPVVICAAAKPRQAGTIAGQALCVVNLAYVTPFEEDQLEAAGLQEMPPKGRFAWVFDDLDWIVPFPLPADAGAPGTGLFDIDGRLVDRIPLELDSATALQRYYEPLITWEDAHQNAAATHAWWNQMRADF